MRAAFDYSLSKVLSIVALVCVSAFALDASAQSAPSAHTNAAAASPQVIGLGLSKLHWDMSPEEVQGAYPALGWARESEADVELTGSYRTLGCTFTITATFLGQPSPVLKRVGLDTNKVGCSRDVQESLVQQFGAAEQQTSPFGIVSREWRIDSNDVRFVQYPDGRLGAPQRISVVFADLTDAVYIGQ